MIGTCTDDLAFGALEIADLTGRSLEDLIEESYLQIFDFLDATGFGAPLRFWNYLTSITADDQGLERYMRFNTGRHRAFVARLKQPAPPAASGVGGQRGNSIIYFLAGRTPARPIENPRQVSAYNYPPVYGPNSPSFSRASVFTHEDAKMLFISGTASIVGHETRHCNDIIGQISETSENLLSLIAAAAESATKPSNEVWSSKIYLRNPDDWEAVKVAIDTIFGAHSQRLFLHGDICRTNLRVEIEAFRHSDL